MEEDHQLATVNQPNPSQPGFGYLVLSFPQVATFKRIGQHFTLSYLPPSLTPTPYNEINKIQICLWLGPGLHSNGWLDHMLIESFSNYLEQQQTETTIFLIWPGFGILSFGESFSRQKSCLITLITDTGTFTDVAPNDIARDLLYINSQPCLLFIWWSGAPNSVVLEAQKLSLKTLVLVMVGNLVKELLGTGAELEGDAVQSPMIQRWYLTLLESLRSVPKDQFLFDPTKVALGIVRHLGKSLMENNRFDIRSKPMLYIPMAFIRGWAEELQERAKSEEGLDFVLKEIVS